MACWQPAELTCKQAFHTLSNTHFLCLCAPDCRCVSLLLFVLCTRSRFPDAPVMAAGYSLGSVLLAKYLAEADNGMYSEQQQPTPTSSATSNGSVVPEPSNGSGLVAAALVSPPVCLHTTNTKMGQPYTFKFLYNLAVAYK